MKKLVSLSIAILFACVAFANNENSAKTKNAPKEPGEMMLLSGVVLDKNTGEALVGVSLKIEGSDQQVFTDFDGKFEIRALGSSKIVSSMPSYKPITVSEIQGEMKIELEPQK